MSQKLLLTFNAGSSTVKIGIFAREQDGAKRIGKGVIDFRAEPLTFHLVEGPQVFDVPLETKTDDLLHDVLEEVFDWLSEHYDLDAVCAVGHRVVHGGDLFADAAGLVLGARVPIILTSRADSLRVRIASAALAKLVAAKRAAALGGKA